MTLPTAAHCRGLRRALWLGLALGWGCAGAMQAPRPPVALQLRTAAGDPLPLAALRGAPVLLLLFATYDSASQLLWLPLATAARDHPGLQVLGIALQPDAETLLPMYAQSLGLSHPLASDPAQAILRGQSDLGSIEGIPQLVLLDADGREVTRLHGPQPPDAVRSWLADALPR